MNLETFDQGPAVLLSRVKQLPQLALTGNTGETRQERHMFPDVMDVEEKHHIPSNIKIHTHTDTQTYIERREMEL